MTYLDEIAEVRIREALQRGELDDLPGQGKPMRMDDLPFVPQELRVGYRILKNAGFLPEEMTIRREIRDVEALLCQAQTGNERSAAAKRLRLLLSRLEARRAGDLRLQEAYYQNLLHRLEDKHV